MYVAIEGIDGSGKDTQLDMLSSYLREKNVPFVRTAEPTTFLPIGLFIKGLLRSCYHPSPSAMTLLFLADVVEHQRERVLPALGEGRWVISSRSFISTLAYQMAAGVEKDFILGLVRALGLRWPDMVIVLDVEAEVALARKRERRHMYERAQFLEEVRKNYLALAREFSFYVVRADRPPDTVFNEIKNILSSYL